MRYMSVADVTRNDRKRPRDRLRGEIVTRRLTIAEVADRCKVSRNHLSEVLWGRRTMTERLARDISIATEIPLEEVEA